MGKGIGRSRDGILGWTEGVFSEWIPWMCFER